MITRWHVSFGSALGKKFVRTTSFWQGSNVCISGKYLTTSCGGELRRKALSYIAVPAAAAVYASEKSRTFIVEARSAVLPVPTVEQVIGSSVKEVEVDFIVVGAGSAGCALAARLSAAFPELTTLLVEAGEDDAVAEIQTAVDYFGKVENVFGSSRDWQFSAVAQSELGSRSLYWPRGKVVGGCSSFNTMVFLRGDPSDYDNWACATQCHVVL